tara:strand:+ start:658 stop:1590 length:933 start_codon:yes stop_codon:yes gene_type:complete
MKQFIIKVCFFVTLSLLSFIIFLRYNGKYIDYFYDKFTTPKQYSMIIGDSRTFDGILPKVLDSCFANTIIKKPTYNFSFTVAQAVYGPSYLEAIKRKLNTDSNNQLFILQVTPWMLANRNPTIQEQSDDYLQNFPPHNMMDMSSNPNFEYLLKNFKNFNFKGFIRKNSILYKDGHLVNNNLPKNKIQFEEWKNKQLSIFSNWKDEWTITDYRFHWLEETVKYLNNYGTIVFVRMPFDKEFLMIENKFCPDFNNIIENIARENKVIFLDYSELSNWSTFDGHHLNEEGAHLFSRTIALDILKNYYKNANSN